MNKANYNSVAQYIKYIRDNFNRTSNPMVGRFFVYNYNFAKHYPWEELKFYDWMPLTFVFEINPKQKTFTGINFHHMPLRPRLLWVNRVKKLAKRVDEQIKMNEGLGGRPFYRIYGLNYPRVYKVLIKSKIAIRKYRFDRVSDLRAVDLRYIDEVMHWVSKTYMGVTIKSIENRYRKYIPKN